MTIYLISSWNPPDCPPGIIEMYHVYVDGFLKTTVRASDKTRALVEGVDSTKVSTHNTLSSKYTGDPVNCITPALLMP